METAVYRVVQESLTNAARHARSDRVEVEVVERDERIHIVVKDDGCGFDVDAPLGGFGSTSMRERISLAGRRMEVASSESGTAITPMLPVAGVGGPLPARL